MAKTLITLQSALDRLGIKAYALYTTCGVRHNTVYDYIKNDKIMLKIEYLTKIMEGLNKLAKEKGLDITFTYDDILKVVDDEEYDTYVKWVRELYEKNK